MIDLSAYSSFIQVVEKRSFIAAAKALGVKPVVVSRRISRLEKELKVVLLKRTTRRMTVTEAGFSFYEGCKRVLAEAKAATALLSKKPQAQSQTPIGRLRVSAPISLGQRVIAPLSAHFLGRHPGVHIELRLGGGSEESDVSFRVSRETEVGAMTKVLCKYRRALCASPSYLAQAGYPEDPAALVRHNCPHLTSIERWHLWGPKGATEVEPRGSFRTDNIEALLAALIGGAGVSLLPLALMERELAVGALELVLPEYQNTEDSLYAVFSQSPPSAAAEAFSAMVASKVSLQQRLLPSQESE